MFIILYVTHANMDEAKKISDHLLQNKMIACTNFSSIKSSYRWKGEITNDDEIVTLFKTRAENREIVRDEIKKIHPYDIPCIIKMEVTANNEYESRIQAETKK